MGGGSVRSPSSPDVSLLGPWLARFPKNPTKAAWWGFWRTEPGPSVGRSTGPFPFRIPGDDSDLARTEVGHGGSDLLSISHSALAF